MLTDIQLLMLDEALAMLEYRYGPTKSIKVRKLQTDLFQDYGINTHGAVIRRDRARERKE